LTCEHRRPGGSSVLRRNVGKSVHFLDHVIGEGVFQSRNDVIPPNFT
jgi:hypothetical protein